MYSHLLLVVSSNADSLGFISLLHPRNFYLHPSTVQLNFVGGVHSFEDLSLSPREIVPTKTTDMTVCSVDYPE